MKYVSLDTETTGTNDKIHQVIEIGAVIDDLENPKPLDELPEFHTYVEHETYNVDGYCLGMHSDTGIFDKLSEYGGEKSENVVGEEQAVSDLNSFIRWELDLEGWPGRDRGHLNVCCHNFTVFDFRFLRRAIDRHYDDQKNAGTIWDVNRIRPFDPCNFYMKPSDEKVCGTRTAMERAGIESENLHTAVADARDMVRLTRDHFNT